MLFFGWVHCNRRVLIEPFIGIKLQQFHENTQSKVDDSVIHGESITEQDIMRHDLFSVAFMILHTQIPELPTVFRFHEKEFSQIISFDFERFAALIDSFFGSLMYEDKFIKILKKMVDYEGIKKSIHLFYLY